MFPHSQKAGHADICACECYYQGKGKYTCCHDYDVSYWNELCNVAVVFYHPVKQRYQYSVGNDSGNESYAEAA